MMPGPSVSSRDEYSVSTNYDPLNLSSEWLKQEVSTGTSIFAVAYNGGVVIGADSRTTSGPYIVNRVTDKLTKLTDHIFCCRSGSAADTQAIADVAAYRLSLDSVQEEEEPTVYAAAHIFKKMCYQYRDDLSAGIIVAGWDKRNGGEVYAIPIGGMLVKQKFAIGGSGSTYIYGYVDHNYREDMTKEECMKFTRDGLALAMARDGSSGGVIRLAVINEAGVERALYKGDEIPRFFEG